MFNFIGRVRAYFAREAARHEKLDTIFQQGKHVKSASSGKVYSVVWVDLNAAMLRNVAGGDWFILDWFTPAGTIHTEVADSWEPVAA